MKSSMLQKLNYILLGLLAAGFVMVLISVLHGNSSVDGGRFAGTQRPLYGWQLVLQDTLPQPVLLPQSYKAAAGVTLVTRLDDLSISQGLVNLIYCQTSPGHMTVYIGDRVAYTCPDTVDGLLTAANVGREHYIPIVAGDFGQPLRITLLPQSGCETVSLHSALLTTGAGALMAAFMGHFGCICLDFATMVVGLIMVLAYCVMLRHAKHPPLLCLGLVLVCYAIWNNAYLNTLLALTVGQRFCYLTLYILGGLIGVLWLMFAFFLNKKRHEKFFNVLILLLLVSASAALITDMLLPATVSRNFWPLDMVVALIVILSLGMLAVDYYRYRDIDRHVVLGLAGAVACIFAGMLDAFFRRGARVGFLLELGALFFSACFTIGLVIGGIDVLVLKSRLHMLELAAYCDQLTGCENRRAFDQKLESYCGDHGGGILTGLAMAMFDSNNLKVVNDTYGHARGDQLIIDTAAALRRYLGNFGTVYRIGGDEFVAVCDNIDRCALGIALETFDREVNMKGEAGIDVSWGLAYYKPEIDADPYSVLMRAEYRMYEYKKGCKL